MKWLFTILTCAIFAASPIGVRAGDSPEKRSRDDSEKRKEDWKKLSPEEREAKMKEWRKTNGVSSKGESEKRREQFKNMTPEERTAKRKEIKGRLEKRITELRAKLAGATISAQETKELERREKILKHFEQASTAAPRIERPKPVFTNSPVQK